MMEFQSVDAPIIAATFTFAAFAGDCHFTHFFTARINGLDKILAAIFVTTVVFSHVVT